MPYLLITFQKGGYSGMKEWGMINKIKKELEAGKSISEISRELGIDRKTVRKYRDMTHEDIAKKMNQNKKRSKKVDKFKDYINKRIKEYEAEGKINCESLFYELKELGYKGSARTLRRYVSRFRKDKGKRRIYKPFETPPGHQAMVDIGEKRRVEIGGRLTNIYFMAMVLSYSRKKYVEWFKDPIDTTQFIHFHQRAFKALGGICNQIVYDQTKLAVIEEKYGEIEFNEEFYRFAHQLGFEPYICHKYDPESKGKIEAVIRYIKHGFLLGRSFKDFSDLEFQWEKWLKERGDKKKHATTHESPLKLWEKEKFYLKPFPIYPYEPRPCYQKRKVTKDGLIKVLGNDYSVPYSYQGKEVKIRFDEEKIHIYSLNEEHIYSHFRCMERGQRIIEPSHYQRPYSISTEQLEQQVLDIYPFNEVFLFLKARFKRHYREQLKGIIGLKKRYPREVLENAIKRAIMFKCLSYGQVEKIAHILQSSPETLPEIMQKQAEIANIPIHYEIEKRPCSYYGQLLINQKQES